eukprot:TRINITY_DN2272_c0_g1_i2.p1 TRINITY_DN2272_c0_g1~~TRINITY_DN2272_c0_g1_i2.p1  ORF type:complete len:229 (-),score=36.16 TRINITY_DN2272_c0_g1_i2:59-745(-)
MTYAVDNTSFLVIPFGMHFSEVQARDFILVDSHTSKVLNPGSGAGAGVASATAFYLHSRIHLAFGELATCLLHTHSPYATALSMIKDESGRTLKMVHQNSMRFQNTLGYDWNYSGLVLDNTEGDRIAAVMKEGTDTLQRKLLLLGNHGVLCADKTVALAYNSHYYLERACKHQVLAMSTGADLREIAPAVCEESKKYFPGKEEEYYADYHFSAMRRMLDKTQPDYKEL